MADSTAGEQASSPPTGGGPPAAAPLDLERLAEQVADRVYRLMAAEARLSQARGQAIFGRERGRR